MSEVLLQFLEPYFNHWKTEEELRKLLLLGMVCWNAALESGTGRAAFIEQMLQKVPPEAQQDMRLLIEELVQRKEAHFASNRRAMLDYELNMTPTGPNLRVMSTVDIT